MSIVDSYSKKCVADYSYNTERAKWDACLSEAYSKSVIESATLLGYSKDQLDEEQLDVCEKILNRLDSKKIASMPVEIAYFISNFCRSSRFSTLSKETEDLIFHQSNKIKDGTRWDDIQRKVCR